jgi:rhamnosyl/mannosyltransferase
VAPSDPRALGNAMRVLWQDPARAARMGQQAAARYASLFTSQQMAAAYTSLYYELVARRAHMPDRSLGIVAL